MTNSEVNMYSLTKYAGSLRDYTITENTLALGLNMTEFAETPLTDNGRNYGRMKVTLSSPQSGIIKINACVRYTGKDETAVVNARPSAAGAAEEDEDALLFKAGMLEARIQRAGAFRIVFSYCGNAITATSINSFFNTRRPAEYTGACFDITPGESCYGLGGSGVTDLIGRKEETDNMSESAAFNKIPFYVSSRGYGIFVNTTGLVKFDFASQNGAVTFSNEGETIEFYVIAGGTPSDVIAAYTQLLGRENINLNLCDGLSLNYAGNYDYDEQSILSDLNQAHEYGITISEIWLGHGYLPKTIKTGFSWDPARFPDPAKFIRKIHDLGIRIGISLSPYISDAVPEFAECVDNDYLVKNSKGEPVLTEYENGTMGIIDVLSQPARNWLGLKFDSVLQLGIDMVEADFKYELLYTEGMTASYYNNFAVAFNNIVTDCSVRCVGSGNSSVIRNSTGAGDTVAPYRNIYMNKNTASYSSLACAVNNAISYGMTGYGIINMDIPSIASASPTLYTRWTQAAMIMPHYRLPVPFCKDAAMLENLKKMLDVRSGLLSYVESCCIESANFGMPVARPMSVEFPTDRLAQKCPTQFMLGSAVMVCPVYSTAGNVSFYVPAGTWTNYITREKISGPRIVSRKVEISELPVYVRPNSIIPSHAGETVVFSCFELSEGNVAAAEVLGQNKSLSGVVNVLKAEDRITVKTEGFGRASKKLVLNGITNVVGVSEGFPENDQYGTTIEFSSNELIITLG